MFDVWCLMLHNLHDCWINLHEALRGRALDASEESEEGQVPRKACFPGHGQRDER